MIADARRKAAYQVNATMIDLYWGIGEFVSNKAVQDGWGRSCPKTKSDAERLFYLKLASREKYKAKENFKPEYLGKMQFYLEALDRDVKKPHENPSVGIILCKSKEEDVESFSKNQFIMLVQNSYSETSVSLAFFKPSAVAFITTSPFSFMVFSITSIDFRQLSSPLCPSV